MIAPDSLTESSVIGALLIEPSEIPFALDELEGEEFLTPSAQAVYRAIRDEYKARKNVDIVRLASRLDADLTRYAMDCMEVTPTAANLRDYIGQLKEAAQRRTIEGETFSAIREAGDSGELLEGLRRVVEDGTRRDRSGDLRKRSFDEAVKFMQSLEDTDAAKRRISTGWISLDAWLGGLELGTLSYVGARPSTGKTAFALNVLLHQWRKSRRAVMFSLEMSAQQIFERLAASSCQVPYTAIRNRTLDAEQKQQVLSAIAHMNSTKYNNVTIIDDVLTIEGIAGAVSRLQPELVVVDFIQMVRTSQRMQDRRAETDYISSEFKQMARRHNCHVMVLAQINREGADKPKMSHLKESGGLEQDGDYIMLLHRPYVADKSSSTDPGEAYVMIDKNKYGACGQAKMDFIPQYQQFRERRN